MQALGELPLVGTTRDVRRSDAVDYWHSVFGEVWGPIHMTEVGARQLSGSLHSRQIGGLTFNRVEYGHQAFACANRSATSSHEPFFSLTFPQFGSARCIVGSTQMTLSPNHAYLINVNSSSRMRVDQHYSTVNIQIPVSRMQNRLGRGVEIIPLELLRSDPIYHLTQHLITEITQNAGQMDETTSQFLTSQLLDTVAFFLKGKRETEHETIALKCARARPGLRTTFVVTITCRRSPQRLLPKHAVFREAISTNCLLRDHQSWRFSGAADSRLPEK